MKAEQHHFVVKGASPPTIEVDTKARSVYVRFKRGPVSKTIAQESNEMHVAVDLDSKGEVVGIEAVGIMDFSIHMLMEKASVKAPGLDFSRARYQPIDLAEA
jgi:uncharacterized protein YuzE